MKTLFIEARSDENIIPNKKDISLLPKNIGIITTVQHAHKINELIEFLKKQNKNPIIKKNKQKYPGQILGCDVSNAELIKDKVDCFLYIGSGNFHPIEAALKTDKKVYCYNPLSRVFSKVNENEVERYKKRIKGAKIRFLSSKEIGVLISVKPGQYNLEKAKKLKEKYKDKNFYFLIFDTLRKEELENFNFIECFVNTACPRIAEDELNKAVINIEDIDQFLNIQG